MSKKVVTLGEIMLRLSTPDYKRFVQADTFDITYGGITPALSDKAAALTEAALKAAKAKGITTSIGHRSMVNCGNAIIGKTSYVMKNHIKPFRNTL